MRFVRRYVIVHLHLARAKNFQMEIHMLCYWTRALDSQRCLRKGTLVRISVHTLNSDAVIVAVETVGRSVVVAVVAAVVVMACPCCFLSSAQANGRFSRFSDNIQRQSNICIRYVQVFSLSIYSGYLFG